MYSFLNILQHLRLLMQNSLFPERDPKLTEFLTHVVGFDSVDDESKPERFPHTPRYPIHSSEYLLDIAVFRWYYVIYMLNLYGVYHI